MYSIRIGHRLRLRSSIPQPDHIGVKICNVLFQQFTRVALGIDRDEYRRRTRLGFRVIRSKRAQSRTHDLQVCEPNIWANGIAEIDQHEPAPEVSVRDTFAILIRQAERPTDLEWERKIGGGSHNEREY